MVFPGGPRNSVPGPIPCDVHQHTQQHPTRTAPPRPHRLLAGLSSQHSPRAPGRGWEAPPSCGRSGRCKVPGWTVSVHTAPGTQQPAPSTQHHDHTSAGPARTPGRLRKLPQALCQPGTASGRASCRAGTNQRLGAENRVHRPGRW